MFSRQARRCCSVVHQHGLWQWRVRNSTSFGGARAPLRHHFGSLKMSLWSPSCIPIWLAPPKKISTNFPACADPLICTCGDLGRANQWVRTTIACGAKKLSPESPWRNVFATSCCLSFFATKICKPQHQTGLGIFWMSGSFLDRLLISKIRCKHLRVRLRRDFNKQPT